MNKLKIHDMIINRARLRDLKKEPGFHIHHIVPKSLGGTNDTTNLVKLTLKEHFVIHKLLIHIYIKPKENHKMIFALHRLCTTKDGSLIPSSSEYEKICQKMSKAKSIQMQGNNCGHGNLGKKFSNETKAKIRQAIQVAMNKESVRNKISRGLKAKKLSRKGRQMSPEACLKISLRRRVDNFVRRQGLLLNYTYTNTNKTSNPEN